MTFNQLYTAILESNRNYNSEGYKSREYYMWRDILQRDFDAMNAIFKDVTASRKRFNEEFQTKEYNYVQGYRTHMIKQARKLHDLQQEIDKSTKILEEVIQRDDAMDSWRASGDYRTYIKAKETTENFIAEILNEN